MYQADIVKVFSMTALSTLVRMCTGLISVKIVAVIIGPAGIALLGQLNNFSTIIMNVSSAGINSGVTKYIAEYREDEHQVKKIISTAFRITLWGGLLCGVFMILFFGFLSRIIMLSDDYGYVFIVFGFTIILYAINNLIVSVLNGYKEFKTYVAVSIVSSVLGLAFTLVLVLILGLKGALISAVTFQSVMLFVTLWMLKRFPWFSFSYIRQKYSGTIARKYLNYAAMTLVSVSVVPVAQLIIRSHIITDMSEIEAGWWEAMNRLSGMYLLVVTSSFGVYYLPRLSEIKDRLELRREIFKAYKVIMPILIVGFIFIYLLRTWVVRLLFTPDFMPMTDLFIWQLGGDLFKIASWLLAFLMLAKSMTKTYIITEIMSSGLYLGLAFAFMSVNGIVGVVQSYLLTYIIYTITMIFIFRKKI